MLIESELFAYSLQLGCSIDSTWVYILQKMQKHLWGMLWKVETNDIYMIDIYLLYLLIGSICNIWQWIFKNLNNISQ